MSSGNNCININEGTYERNNSSIMAAPSSHHPSFNGKCYRCDLCDPDSSDLLVLNERDLNIFYEHLKIGHKIRNPAGQLGKFLIQHESNNSNTNSIEDNIRKMPSLKRYALNGPESCVNNDSKKTRIEHLEPENNLEMTEDSDDEFFDSCLPLSIVKTEIPDPSYDESYDDGPSEMDNQFAGENSSHSEEEDSNLKIKIEPMDEEEYENLNGQNSDDSSIQSTKLTKPDIETDDERVICLE